MIEPGGEVVGCSQAPTSIETDVLDGASQALAALPSGCGEGFDWALACSSAAGGLRMGSVGLTEALSGRAATFAVLGAGAKVVAVEAGYLDDGAIARLQSARPHLVLLSGGTDGGNEAALRFNADRLASLQDVFGVVIAGNRAAAEAAGAVLEDRGRDVRVVDNVFPGPGEVVIAPSREAIRELFMLHITRAKGIDALMAELRCDCEPTPLAVSRALWDLVGEPVALVDVGGATTDVHSVAPVVPAKGARPPVPEVARTVEGDLGVRAGAPAIVEAMGASLRARLDAELASDLGAAARRRREQPALLAGDASDRAVDAALAGVAVAVAVGRHAGDVIVEDRAWGERREVIGRDLRQCRLLLATGGVFAHSPDAAAIIRTGLSELGGRSVPELPSIVVDRGYVVYAIGLVARIDRALAARMGTQLLKQAA